MDNLQLHDITRNIISAINARQTLIDADKQGALRLFNGFYEGFPDLVVDRYANTIVIFDHSKPPHLPAHIIKEIQTLLLERFPFIECIVVKQRRSPDPANRNGQIVYGSQPDEQITEHGVHYSVDLQMNQDASFYLDTRNLRNWLMENAKGWQVLNLFAYTGSLGIATLAGGASHVTQSDHNRNFLSLARKSAMLNRLDLGKMKLQAADFFSQVAFHKRRKARFDCVIVDPPFFSTTGKGTVDLVNESTRVINKVRPLVRDGGCIVTINNALFLPGAAYMESLEVLCKDGYLTIDQIIPVPEDITGFPGTIQAPPPSDPAPFNHPTKIAVLGVTRKAA